MNRLALWTACTLLLPGCVHEASTPPTATVQPAKPLALVSPSVAASQRKTYTATLKWNPVSWPSASFYAVGEGSAPGVYPSVFRSDGTTYQLSLAYGTLYYFAVRLGDTNGLWSDWSQPVPCLINKPKGNTAAALAPSSAQ